MRFYWAYATYSHTESYHRLSKQLSDAIERRGHEVIPLPPYIFGHDTPGRFALRAHPDIGAVPTIAAGTPGFMYSKVGKCWGFTMYESTKLPDGWANILNAHCERVLVPSLWCAKVFRANDYNGNLHVIPLGVDPVEFAYIDRPARDTYTFLALADRGLRKGWDIVLHAFYRAFGEPGQAHYAPDVRLIFKAIEIQQSLLHYVSHFADRRVRLWRENVSNMADVYSVVDCLVFPSHGEGFGLPPREAAATGLPVICTDYSGMAGEVANWGLRIDAEERPTGLAERYEGYAGSWGHPDAAQVADAMRWCYEHREEAKDVGRRGSKWLHEHLTWDHSAEVFLKLVERVG